MARATQERCAHKLLSTKGLHAELVKYLAEDLYFVDESESSEQQAEAVFQWWKVCFDIKIPSNLLIHWILDKCSEVSHPQLHRI